MPVSFKGLGPAMPLYTAGQTAPASFIQSIMHLQSIIGQKSIFPTEINHQVNKYLLLLDKNVNETH
jgi:hypothetical protein